MKTVNKIFILLSFIMVSFYSYAQNVRIANLLELNFITSSGNSSAFLDASSHSTHNTTANIAKGLVFPRVDLTTFTFSPSTGVGLPSVFPTRFDGMIVYNTATSGVAFQGATEGGKLTAGFWFYENKTATLTGGIWKQLGHGGVVEKKRIIGGDNTYIVGGDTVINLTYEGDIVILGDTILPAGNNNGDILVWNATLRKWIPQPGGSGGGGGDLPPGAKDGDVLVWNATLNQWVVQPGGATPKDFWVPSINIPWEKGKTFQLLDDVDLFAIYAKSFLGATNPNFRVSPGGPTAIPGHPSVVATDFYYVVTDFDVDFIDQVVVNEYGKLSYKCTNSIVVPKHSFINVLMIRK